MMKSETLLHVRSVCINQILGTDMKKHFDITSRFQVSPQAKQNKFCYNLQSCLHSMHHAVEHASFDVLMAATLFLICSSCCISC